MRKGGGRVAGNIPFTLYCFWAVSWVSLDYGVFIKQRAFCVEDNMSDTFDIALYYISVSNYILESLFTLSVENII